MPAPVQFTGAPYAWTAGSSSAGTLYPSYANPTFILLGPPSRIVAGAPLATLNTFDGGTDGATITTGNSGGASGDPWTFVSIPTGGSAVYVASGAYRGGMSGSFTTGTTGSGAYAERLTGVSSTGSLYVRGRFRMPVLPPDATGVRALVLADGPGAFQLDVRMTNAGTVELRTGTGTLVGTSSATYAAGDWVDYDAAVLSFSATTGQLELRLRDANGTVVQTITSAATVDTLRGGGANKLQVGAIRSGVVGFTTQHDDVAMSSAGYLDLPSALPGVAALAGSATLLAAATVTATAAAMLDASSALTADAVVLVPGAATLAAGSTLNASSGGAATVPGTASLGATSTLTATAVVRVPGAALLAGAGALTASGAVLVPGVAAMSATSTLTAASTVRVSGSASLVATSALAASVGSTTAGTAALAATSTLTATGQVVRTATAALPASGALTATATVRVTGAAALTAAGSLAGVASLRLSGTAALAGSSALTITIVATGPVVRPNTGTTTRPGTGTTARPNAGTTARATGTTVRPYVGTTARP